MHYFTIQPLYVLLYYTTLPIYIHLRTKCLTLAVPRQELVQIDMTNDIF